MCPQHDRCYSSAVRHRTSARPKSKNNLERVPETSLGTDCSGRLLYHRANWHLAEGQIVGKPSRTQIVSGAFEQRKKRTTADVGTSHTTAEPSGNRGSGKRLFEQRLVALGAPHKDSNLVERQTGFRK